MQCKTGRQRQAISPSRAMTYALSGFSLIEVLVALVILSVSLGALYGAATLAITNARVAHEYAVAVILAESVLDQHRFVTTAQFEASGVWGEYSWAVRSWPVALEEPEEVNVQGPSVLQNVEASVTWADPDQGRTVDLMTVVPLRATMNE